MLISDTLPLTQLLHNFYLFFISFSLSYHLIRLLSRKIPSFSLLTFLSSSFVSFSCYFLSLHAFLTITLSSLCTLMPSSPFPPTIYLFSSRPLLYNRACFYLALTPILDIFVAIFPSSLVSPMPPSLFLISHFRFINHHTSHHDIKEHQPGFEI